MPEKLRWPATPKQLYEAGYNRAMMIEKRACKRCGTRIEFWHTPDSKLMPLEVNPEDKTTLLCHFYTCPHASEFRKPEHKPQSTQRGLFE